MLHFRNFITTLLIFVSAILWSQTPSKTTCTKYETKKAISIGGKLIGKGEKIYPSQNSFSKLGLNSTFVAPANDDCLNAQVVTPNGTCIPGTTVTAADNLTGVAGCQAGAPNSHEDVWYSFVATGSVFTATVTAGAGWTGNVEFLLLSGTCAGGFTILNSTCAASPLSVNVTGLLPGTTYYFVVANDAAGANGAFTVCPTTSTPPVNCTDNDDCLTPTNLTYTVGTQTCITDCNVGSAPGPDFLGTNCYDFTTPTVWYSVTTNANTASLNINLASSTIPNPYFAIFTTSDCSNYTIINCTQGTAGAASVTIPVSVNTTYLIAISDQTGATGNFNLCYTLNTDNSACNTGDILTEQSSSDPTTPIGGPYSPGETVNFCYTINQFKKANCNWLMGIVPTFGNCWSPSSFNAQGKPVTSSGPVVAGSAAGTWQWYPAGAVVYNNIAGGYVPPNTPLPAGWFFQCNTCGISSLDPDNSWGDGDATGPPGTECDPNGNGYTWTVCFSLIAGPSGNCTSGNTDCGISIKTYADGEVGGWTDIGCTADLPFNWYASLFCCLPANVNAGSNPVLNCSNSSVSLNGSSTTTGASYSWSGPGIVSGGNTATPTVNAAGIYTLTVNATGVCTNTDTVRVLQNTIQPNVTTGTAQTITCTSSTVTLTGSSTTTGVNYAWTGPGIVSGANTSSATANANGTYTLTVTNPANGCTNSSTVSVSTNTTLPNVFAGNDQLLTCAVTSVNLTGSSTTPGVSYAWQGPSAGTPAGTTPSASSTNVTSVGTYTLTVTNPTNGCVSTDQVVVNPDANIPNANAGSAQTLTCATTSVTLSGSSTTSGVNYSWTGSGIVSGANTTSPVVNSAGTYTLTVTNPANGCTTTSTVLVTANNSVPTLTISPASTIDCANLQVTLNATTSATNPVVSWTGPGIVSGANTLSPIVNTVGSYSLVITDPSNGCSNNSSILVSGNTTQPNVSSGTAQTITCTSSTVTLTGSSTTAGVNYAWTGPGIVSGANTSSATANANGTYTLTVTNPANGCTNSSTVSVSTNTTLPNVFAGNDLLLTCAATSVNLTGSSTTPGVSYSWQGPSVGNPAGITPSASSTNVSSVGTYTLTVTNPTNGCVATDQVVVNPDANLPNADAGSAQTLTCATTLVNLSGSSTTAGVNYSWTGSGIVSGSNTANPVVNSAGTYTLTVSNPSNGCTATSTVLVSLNNTQPSITIPSAPVIDCNNSQISLTASSSATNPQISWTGPGIVSGANTFSPTINSTGTYVITVTDPSNGCSNTSNVTVNSDLIPPDVFAGNDQTLTCGSTSLTLNGGSTTPGVSFNWTGPGIVSVNTTSTVTVNLTGQYTLTVTNPVNGCSATDFADVLQSTNIPDITPGADQFISCANSSVALSASSTVAGVTFSWSGPSSFIASGSSTTANQVGIYTVTVFNPSNNCTNTVSIQVNDSTQLPGASAGNDVTLTCSLLNTNLNGSSLTPNVNYIWTGPNSFSSNSTTISVSTQGQYTLTVINTTTGCSSTDVVDVLQNTNVPDLSISNPAVLNCNTNSVSLTSISQIQGLTYAWVGPNGFSSTSSNPSVTDSGTYTLLVTDPINGCTSTASVSVLQNTLQPTGTLSSSVSNLNCNQTSTILTAAPGSNGFNVEWSNNSVVISGNPITVNAAGTYTCTFQDPSNGCSSQQTIVISIDTLSPIISLSTDNDTLNCAQTFADLFSISNVNSSYSWTGPSGFSSSLQNPGTINVSGTYNLQVTDLINGCTSNASIFIDSIPNPIASFIADPSIGTAPLTVNFTNTSSNGFNSYDWNFGNLSGSTLTNPSNLYSDPGTYTVTLIGYGATNACNDTVTAEIVVYPEATVIIPNIFTPNGDSINDVFSFTTSGLRDLEADIFDRWGLRVGKIIGVNGFWDGSGSSAGTYYFVLIAKTLDGKEIKKNGYILLAK